MLKWCNYQFLCKYSSNKSIRKGKSGYIGVCNMDSFKVIHAHRNKRGLNLCPQNYKIYKQYHADYWQGGVWTRPWTYMMSPSDSCYESSLVYIFFENRRPPLSHVRFWLVLLQGFYSLIRHRLIGIGIPIIKLTRSSDCLRLLTRILMPVRRRLVSDWRPPAVGIYVKYWTSYSIVTSDLRILKTW